MNGSSQETLRRIEQNDVSCNAIKLGHSDFDGWFISSDASDYSRLGAAIGKNIHLTKLRVYLGANRLALDTANHEFFNGLKHNSSISDMVLQCRNQTLVGGVGHEILKSYQKINNNLTRLCIQSAVLNNGGCNVITETLRWCTNLKSINLALNSIIDEQLLPIVDAIRGGCDTSLENLHFSFNRIGNAGCHALVTLLDHTNFNLQSLDLESNQIGNEGATAIANSLFNNTKIQTLDLQINPFDPSAVGIFCTVLCNTSSVNDTYHSNHTLGTLHLSDEQKGQYADHLASLLDLNTYTNKSHVAIKKILKCHPNIDMEPLFEWDAEGEQTLKALPFVIDWFERAEEAVAGVEEREDYHVEEKKLSAIFQFAKAMPLFFAQPFYIDEGSKKRKRD